MKKLLLVLTIASYGLADEVYVVETAYPASQAKSFNPWIFEVENLSPDPLFIDVFNGGTSYTDKASSFGFAAARRSRGKEVNQHGFFRLADPRFSTKSETLLHITQFDGTKRVHDRFYRIIPNPNRNHLFFTWDKGTLTPQPKNRKNETPSGIPFTNNIDSSQIKPGEPGHFFSSEINKLSALKDYYKYLKEQDELGKAPTIEDLTYYQLLGVDSKADETTIQSAYKEKKRHAKNPKLIELLDKAYATLKDKQSRKKYDEKLILIGEFEDKGLPGKSLEDDFELL